MEINLLTDAPKHNLALMKIATYHKNKGDTVYLNYPILPNYLTYTSLLFEKSIPLFMGDIIGGPAFFNKTLEKNKGDVLPKAIEDCKPDYTLFGLDYSLGYTYRPCYRNCQFCKVGLMSDFDKQHHSIWEFHDPKLSKICLLNNNTFLDKQWQETFNEIWDADLKVIDENGYDLRLIDDEKANALKRTKFHGYLHFAWDRMQDEDEIVNGLKCLKKYNVRGRVYILVCYDTTTEADIYRCQIIKDFGFDFYIMPYRRTKYGRAFKRFADSFIWRKYKFIEEAWSDYNPKLFMLNKKNKTVENNTMLSSLWNEDTI